MKKFKLGWILFPRRGEDFWTSVDAYKKLGYSGMEMGDMMLRQPGASPEENLARLRSLGLEVVSVGANQLVKYGEAAIDGVIESAKLTGAKFACCYVSSIINPMMGKPECDKDTFYQEIENLEKAAERCAAAGLKLCYHNHNYEFLRMFDGLCAFDQMVARTSTLSFEPDCGWATYAGVDPVKLLDRLAQRVTAIHLKDFIPGRDVTSKSEFTGAERIMPCFTSVGSGCLNLLDVTGWAADHEIEWCTVEQDTNNNLTSLESLQCSILNVRETGFVAI